ncbi:hypothetical protein LTR10_020933 [Elasticomyces elasticus]|uniref:BTB domain-containing protein n=1 Tax=Exophiala sideris TaxID=1016849 RepID=A0ABR0JBQ1_9EURO|nr:hypothetical protein LTR10_020933 [Elasticomyces elasticus]KAK5031108.1 hypothetical protein LTS07_004843 [Exophiala sideris]KAK5038830.1 hypothetical protein LTR13_003861 [Exophiala sideris]KAK5060713.1 hypothetical protein LTR69_005312 [Exophiala sideris]KAK5183626.1 hypothetical protein LTR44_003908 [Eurotiomycetes sp. CCFEE 6388]
MDSNTALETGDTPCTPQSFAHSLIVTFIVGPEKYAYTAHKAVVINKCPFVAKCLAVGMIESTTHTINLPEDSPAAFDHFISWIYHGEVIEIEQDNTDKLLTVLKAWVLADKLCMPAWQNRLIDSAMTYLTKHVIEPSIVSWGTDHLSNESLLFDLIMDQFAWDVARTGSKYTDVELELLVAKPEFATVRLLRQSNLMKVDRAEESRATEPARDRGRYRVAEEEQTCKPGTEMK